MSEEKPPRADIAEVVSLFHSRLVVYGLHTDKTHCSKRLEANPQDRIVSIEEERFGSDRKSLQRKEWRRLLPGLNFPGPNNFYLKNANKLGTEKVNMKLQQFDNITQTVHVETKMLKITNRAK